tara:strand:- start:42 stop:689 length:648 start_codon:yes stop_codon:yes gene_type:complete
MSFEYVPGKEILKNVSMHLTPGSFTFIAGPSGAGKSSLLNLLSLSLKPTQGRLELFGEDVTLMGHDTLPDIRRKIGTVFQDYALLDHLNVAENVALPLKVMGESRATIRDKVAELLEWVGLEEYHHVKPPHLSGGQKQRVAIARAVINQPLLLLADEPTGNLDSELSMRFMRLFTALNKAGTTIVFATHDEYLMSHFDFPTLYVRNGQLQRGRRP